MSAAVAIIFPLRFTKKAGASVTLTLLSYRAKNGEPFWKTSHIQGSNKASVPRLIWRLIFTWQEKKAEESVDMNFLNFIFFFIEIFLFCLPCHIRLIFIVCLAGSLGNACASRPSPHAAIHSWRSKMFITVSSYWTTNNICIKATVYMKNKVQLKNNKKVLSRTLKII